MEVRFPSGDDTASIVAVLFDAAQEVGIDVGSGLEVEYRKGAVPFDRARRVQLQPRFGSDHYRKYKRGRRTQSVCWHGHREWMRGVLRRNPSAVIITALARYDGAVDFEEKHVTTEDSTLFSGDCHCTFVMCEGSQPLALVEYSAA